MKNIIFTIIVIAVGCFLGGWEVRKFYEPPEFPFQVDVIDKVNSHSVGFSRCEIIPEYYAPELLNSWSWHQGKRVKWGEIPIQLGFATLEYNKEHNILHVIFDREWKVTKNE